MGYSTDSKGLEYNYVTLKGAHTNTTKRQKYKDVSVSSSSGLVVLEIERK